MKSMTIVRLIRIIGGVIGTLALASGCASMQGAAGPGDSLERIKASHTIRLGYRESAVPFSFVSDDGKPAGYSIELCTRIANALQGTLSTPNLAIKWVPVTAETRIPALLDGTIDLECGATTRTLSREEQVDFSLMTFLTGGSLLILADSPVQDDLGGARIGVIPSTTTEEVLQTAVGRSGGAARLVSVKDHADGLARLEDRTVDAYASDRVILLGLVLASKDPKKFAVAKQYFSYEPYALMLRRDPSFRLAVNRVLARIYRSGEIARIYQRWLGPLGTPGDVLEVMYIIEGLPE